jgi:putative transcriptional regulator
MAVVRKSLGQIRAGKPRVDRAKLDATTEADIRRHQIEDDEYPDAPLEGFTWNVPARAARQRLNMTQEQMAALLRIPVATLRNWEQGRVRPDQAAQALLTILYRRPEMAKEALTMPNESAA